MQAKDIPDRDVLTVLAHAPALATWRREPPDQHYHAIPIPNWLGYDAPEKVVLAKMRALIKRRLVDGCACNCRGDFTLTDKGRVFLVEQGESETVRAGIPARLAWWREGGWGQAGDTASAHRARVRHQSRHCGNIDRG